MFGCRGAGDGHVDGTGEGSWTGAAAPTTSTQDMRSGINSLCAKEHTCHCRAQPLVGMCVSVPTTSASVALRCATIFQTGRTERAWRATSANAKPAQARQTGSTMIDSERGLWVVIEHLAKGSSGDSIRMKTESREKCGLTWQCRLIAGVGCAPGRGTQQTPGLVHRRHFEGNDHD